MRTPPQRTSSNLKQLSIPTALSVLSVILVLVFGGCTKEGTSQQQADREQSHQHEASQAEEYYTCPMHPSVRSDRPGACPVCHMALVKKTVQKDLDPGDLNEPQAVALSPTQRVMANVSTVRAQRMTVSRDVATVGVVSYAEPNYRHISARFPGRIEQLDLSYTGQNVRRGEPVAEVYSPEAISAQQEFLLAVDAHERAVKGEQSFTETARQLLEQTRQKLLQWGFTENQVRDLEKTHTIKYRVTIVSHVSGTVIKKNVELQQYVSEGQNMFEVADLSTVWIYLDVYEKDIRFVQRGQMVEVSTEAYPYEKFSGRVVFLDPVVNPETRTVRVRTEFPNAQGKLKPNMYAQATIRVPRENALVVPSSAVISTGKRDVVWVEVKPNTFEQRDVMTTPSSGGYAVVLMGLDEGDMVAATGGFLIDSESQLSSANTQHKHGE